MREIGCFFSPSPLTREISLGFMVKRQTEALFFFFRHVTSNRRWGMTLFSRRVRVRWVYNFIIIFFFLGRSVPSVVKPVLWSSRKPREKTHLGYPSDCKSHGGVSLRLPKIRIKSLVCSFTHPLWPFSVLRIGTVVLRFLTSVNFYLLNSLSCLSLSNSK